MQVFITGASGYIGGSVAMALIAAGHRVRGLTRGEASAQRLAQTGIEPVIGTLDDAAVLSSEAGAADAVINTASADHAGAVSTLIEALAGSGKALLHTSGSSVVGDDVRGEILSERVFDDASDLIVSPAKQARRNIDLQVLAAAGRGIRSCVICPSNIYGLGRGQNRDSVQIPFLVANAREQGVVQIVGAGRNVWSNVHIDDVVQLYVLALEKAPPGAFYFAENGEASFSELGQAIAQRLGLAVESLPAVVAAQRWGEPKAYFSLGSNSRVRGLRARQELGWAPSHDGVLAWIAHDMPLDPPLPA